VTRLPLFQQVVPSRLTSIVGLCVAIVLAVVVDRTHGAVREWSDGFGASRSTSASPAPTGAPRGVLAGAVAAAIALVVAAVAVVPIGTALASNTPLTTRTVALPAWFSEVAPHLPPGQVVLTFPPPAVGGSALAWQAVGSLQFAMATGAGPGSILGRAGRQRAAQAVITSAAAALFSQPTVPTADDVAAVRRALADWGVTTVAVPDFHAVPPPFGQPANTAWALGLFTDVLGRAPQFAGGTWVWTDVRNFGSPLHVSAAAFTACTNPQLLVSSPHQAIPKCVLTASGPAT
jgi:hypothetical protein